MLVEGGYLDSMKRLIEKAAEAEEPRSKRRPRPNRPIDPGDDAGIVGRSLRKIATMFSGIRR
jgi:hypothetical protein